MVFYEPVTWGVYSRNNMSLGTGFDRVPGGPSQRSKSVLSYHYYCWILTNESQPFTIFKRILCDDVLMQNVFPSVLSDVARTGGGSFLTEFGECEPDGNPESENTRECELVMRRADEAMQSWTYWDFAFFDDDGNPRMDIVRTFVRPYPRAITGNLTSLKFDVKARVLTFSYMLEKSAFMTEVFVPVEVHYQKGFNVTISPPLAHHFDAANTLLYIRNSKPFAPGTLVNVRIFPCPGYFP